jgi:membrane protein implicated in regulation of membrane protease activity
MPAKAEFSIRSPGLPGISAETHFVLIFIFGLSVLAVFLIIAALGFVFLLLSFFLGDLFEHFNADIDLNSGNDGQGLLDSRVISIFMTSFGGVGAICIKLGLDVALSSIGGLLGGALLGGIVFYFGRLLYRQQASSSVGAHQLIGRTAEVVVTIQPGSVGQISCRIGAERVEKLARAKNNSEIKVGSQVRIDEIAGESVIVSVDDGSRSFLSTQH